jgi:FAD/FMN-containing dehydrogenase
VNRRAFLARGLAGPVAGLAAACAGSGAAPPSTHRRRHHGPQPPPPPPTLAGLRARLRGPLLEPGRPGYDAARTLSNSRYAFVRPRAIAVALDEGDVEQCVRFAAAAGMPFRARSGGHSYAGYSTCPGLVCDVRRLAHVVVAPDGRSVRVGAGTLAYDLVSTLAARGLAVPTGSCPTVGIAGLALGGGLGFAARAMGTTCDTILALRIVTAAGTAVEASPRSHPDLYWACRGGGGGNFGVVTELTLATHPVGQVAYGFCDADWSQAGELVAAWQGLAPHAADDLYLICALETGAQAPVARVFGQLLGGTETALRAAMAPVLRVAGTTLSTATSSYLHAQLVWAGCSTESAAACRTLRPAAFAARSDYAARPLPPAAVDSILRAVERRQVEGTGSGAVLLDPYGGAVNRVAPDATAFVHRDQLFSFQELAYFGAAGEAASAAAWLDELRAPLRPHVSGQAYQNYIDPTLPGWEQAYYGGNLARLRAVREAYDPDRLFRFPQAIP